MLKIAHGEHPYQRKALEVKWHLNIQGAGKIVPVLQLANYFHLMTEQKYSHSMMKNFLTRVVKPS